MFYGGLLMANVPYIPPIIKPYIQPTLPLEYSSEISFLEMLMQFKSKLNDVIEVLNHFEENANSYTDKEIAKLKAYTNSLISNLQNQIDTFNTKLNDLAYSFDIKLKIQFDEIINILARSQNKQDLEFDQKLYNLYTKILSMLTYGFPVINPVTGRIDTVQNSLNDLYFLYMQNFGINVQEYEDLNFTIDEYENYYISVYDYTYLAKDQLFYEYFSPYFNPFNGKRDKLQNIINTLANFHIENLTVDAYNNKNVNVDSYEAANVTVDGYANYI